MLLCRLESCLLEHSRMATPGVPHCLNYIQTGTNPTKDEPSEHRTTHLLQQSHTRVHKCQHLINHNQLAERNYVDSLINSERFIFTFCCCSIFRVNSSKQMQNAAAKTVVQVQNAAANPADLVPAADDDVPIGDPPPLYDIDYDTAIAFIGTLPLLHPRPSHANIRALERDLFEN